MTRGNETHTFTDSSTCRLKHFFVQNIKVVQQKYLLLIYRFIGLNNSFFLSAIKVSEVAICTPKVRIW